MTAAEKAKELVDKYNYEICNSCGLSESESSLTAAKACAIIAVDEILNVNAIWWNIGKKSKTKFQNYE